MSEREDLPHVLAMSVAMKDHFPSATVFTSPRDTLWLLTLSRAFIYLTFMSMFLIPAIKCLDWYTYGFRGGEIPRTGDNQLFAVHAVTLLIWVINSTIPRRNEDYSSEIKLFDFMNPGLCIFNGIFCLLWIVSTCIQLALTAISLPDAGTNIRQRPPSWLSNALAIIECLVATVLVILHWVLLRRGRQNIG